VVDANTVTFAAVGVADGSATGTITSKRAPLGWVKAFAGTNTAVYSRPDPSATTMLLRVDDTAAGVASATSARAVMVETAAGVDSYTAAAPTTAQMSSGGVYISKGANSTTAKAWCAFGDGRTLYLFTDGASYTQAAYGGLHAFAFGDVSSWRAGDAYHCVIMGGASIDTHYISRSTDTPGIADGLYLARLSNQIGGSVACTFQGRSSNGGYSGDVFAASGGVYPSPVDNGMPIERAVLLRESNSTFGNPYRGVARGIAFPLAQIPSTMHLQRVGNLLGTTDEYVIVTIASTSYRGAVMFNVTSDWGA